VSSAFAGDTERRLDDVSIAYMAITLSVVSVLLGTRGRNETAGSSSVHPWTEPTHKRWPHLMTAIAADARHKTPSSPASSSLLVYGFFFVSVSIWWFPRQWDHE
jgi:hypothetical protein